MKNLRNALCAVAAGIFALALLPAPARAGSLDNNVLGMFPKNITEFAYADLKQGRQYPWFVQVEQQMIPANFREFEQFLRSAGVDPDSQVNEIAWGAVAATPQHPFEIAGVALGNFTPGVTESRFAQQKIPSVEFHGEKLWAFGSGSGPNDIFFVFIDSNTAAFGQRSVLEDLINVRYGAMDSLLDNAQLFPLIQQANGNGMIWAVLDQSNTQLALQQLLPQASNFPQAAAILKRIRAMEIHIQGGDGVDAKFQAVCATPEDANNLAAMLQGGIVLRRYQVQQSNPDLASALGNVTVSPSGDHLVVDAPVSSDQLAALIRDRTFAVSM